MTVRYYALRVVPQREFDVQRALNQQEIPALVPREYKWAKASTKGGRRVKKPYPLLARYVFAGFRNLVTELRAVGVKEIQGVVCRTRNEWSPLVMSEADMGLLQNMMQSDRATSFEIHKTLRPGGEARIVAGSFRGQTVKIDSVSARKAKVLLNILNSMHVVTIPIDQLDAA